jgi:hypothetical protein
VLHLFNIVGTRVPRGEFEHARRWYVDHVHLLFGHEGLLGARLWQRVPGAAEVGTAPDMLCFYDFGEHRDSFTAYDNSPLRAEVERDRQSSWGRDGIEVTLRARFRRLYERRVLDGVREARQWRPAARSHWQPPRGAASDASVGARSRIAATTADAASGWERGLAARAHERGLRRLEIYRAEHDENVAQVQGQLGGIWIGNADTAVRPPEAPAPGPAWQGVYLPLEHWTR